MTSQSQAVTEHRIDLPWTTPPLSMNDRGHWSKRAQKIRAVRDTGCWLTRAAHLGRCERVRIQLHYQPGTRRNRDSDNLAATYKPLVDGVCLDAGLVPDDTDAYVVRGWPTIHEPIEGEPGRMWMVIEVLEDVPARPCPQPQGEQGPNQGARQATLTGQPSAAVLRVRVPAKPTEPLTGEMRASQ